jgi:hypothetical protein
MKVKVSATIETEIEIEIDNKFKAYYFGTDAESQMLWQMKLIKHVEMLFLISFI